jgi:hypothetical protein
LFRQRGCTHAATPPRGRRAIVRRDAPRAAAPAVAGSCRYGQALGEADDHDEETNSVGWDLEADILDTVGVLTGNTGAATVNEDFPGWWIGLSPLG